MWRESGRAMSSRVDTLLQVLIVVAVVTVVAAVPNESAPPTTLVDPPSGDGWSPALRSGASTNIPGGPLTGCSGALLATGTAAAGERGGLTLQVYRSGTDGGRTCATVTKTGTAYHRRGDLRVTLQLHSYDGRRWPRYAVQELDPTARRSDAVYLDATDGRCVRASARFDPDDGPPTTITTDKLGCD